MTNTDADRARELLDVYRRLTYLPTYNHADLAACLETMLQPIDMILHCPLCGVQHIDAPSGEHAAICNITCGMPAQGCSCGKWTNPPHRSHLCHGCGCIWRPADVPTNGVKAIKTKGKSDSNPENIPWGDFNRRELIEQIDLANAHAAKAPDGLIAALREAGDLIESLASDQPLPKIRGPLADELHGFAAMLANIEHAAKEAK